jgi:hypothetical protein
MTKDDRAGADAPQTSAREQRSSMTKSFSHPLARRADVWATNIDGKNRDILLIVTTLELDKRRPRYKRGLVDRLSHAAEEYLAKAKGIDSFMLINRPRDWRAESEG